MLASLDEDAEIEEAWAVEVERRVAEIERNGGRIVRQPFDVPDFGRIAIGADVTGAFMAWVTKKR